MRPTLLYICFVLSILSCGQSAQEKVAIENEVMQKLKAKEDSIATIKSNEEAIKNSQKRHDDSIANSVTKKYEDKNQMQNLENQYIVLQKLLFEDNAKLTVLQDRKNKAVQFHLGRTQGEREQQLSKDQKIIDNLKLEMMNITNQMKAIKSK